MILNKKNLVFMNRIRNKFFKPFSDQKRVNLKTSSMARRRFLNSLNKVGSAYGVIVQENGNVVRKAPGTAGLKRRRIKYKILDSDEKKKEIQTACGTNNFIVSSQPRLENVSEQREILQSAVQSDEHTSKMKIATITSSIKIPSNVKQAKKPVISPNFFIETFSTTLSSSNNIKPAMDAQFYT